MTKRLYVVEVLYTAYVWADSESDAQGFNRQIVGTETPEVTACLASDYSIKPDNPLRWPLDALVYHKNYLSRDIRLFDAMEAEQQP